MRKYLFSAGFALLVAATSVSITVMTPPAFASEIKYVVNDVPVTSGDIAHRAAFLKLQRKKGDAAQEMIDQTLRLAEARRLGIRISDAQVEAAYQRFATNNKMQLSQLDGVMEKSGVGKDHFKEFIRAQMAWNQALSARYRSGEGGSVTEQDAVRRMLDKGGAKPSATEYMLQQVIFVVPAAERSATLAKRKREADAMRARHAYAATDNIILDVRIGDHLMGDIFESREAPVIKIHVEGTGPIDKVEVIRNNTFVHTERPTGAKADFTFRDADSRPGETYYYVRVQQKEGQLAWSSPIWVKR